MKDKPDLFLYSSEPLSDLPKKAFEDFKESVVIQRLKPSLAIHHLMDKYECKSLDSSVVISLVEHTFPEINVAAGGFRAKVVDAAYPSDCNEEFGDRDFDKGINELLLHPTKGW